MNLFFNRAISVDIGTRGGVGIQISKLRVEFKAKKTPTPESNQAEVKIFNLSNSSLNRIKEGSVLVLKAGYEIPGEQEIFRGDISLVNSSKERENLVTKIELNDGATTLQSSEVSLSYGRNTSAKHVLQQIIKNMNIPLKKDIAQLRDKNFINGFSFAGKSKEALTEVLNELGASWSIQGGQIRIDYSDLQNTMLSYKITPHTGLLESPEQIEMQEDGKKSRVWKVKSLLLPSLEPGDAVVVESKEVDKSRFKVAVIEHNGDTHGSTWDSTLQLKEL